MMRISVLLAFSLSFALVPAAQATYKWVDEKGVTHYTQNPPPDRPSTKVEVKTPGPPAAEGASDNWKQRELESRRKRAENDRQVERDKARDDKAAAQRTSRCRYARQELDTLQSQRPVYVLNERGERVYLGDKNHARAIEVWRQRVAESCDR